MAPDPAGNFTAPQILRSLELIEAKIYRLSKYYKKIGILPQDFKYSAVVAQLS